MAKAARKILRLTGSLLPKMAMAPKAKAISVAMGIPHPSIFGEPKLKAI
jgi:hypothetical protein